MFTSSNIRDLDSLSVHELQLAADGERQRSKDPALTFPQQQDATNQAAFLSAVAHVRIYQTFPPCDLRDAKLSEAEEELEIAMRDGAQAYAQIVYQHEYGVQRPEAVHQYTGYVASVRKQRRRA